MNLKWHCRKAEQNEASIIADIFSTSRRTLTFVPQLHSVAEDLWFIQNIIFKDCEVTVAAQNSRIAGFVAVESEEVRLLHVHPDEFGQGAGSALIISAQSCACVLELWCFQANHGARRFYERHNFEPIEFTDGQDNEEKIPDVRYRWTR